MRTLIVAIGLMFFAAGADAQEMAGDFERSITDALVCSPNFRVVGAEVVGDFSTVRPVCASDEDGVLPVFEATFPARGAEVYGATTVYRCPPGAQLMGGDIHVVRGRRDGRRHVRVAGASFQCLDKNGERSTIGHFGVGSEGMQSEFVSLSCRDEPVIGFLTTANTMWLNAFGFQCNGEARRVLSGPLAYIRDNSSAAFSIEHRRDRRLHPEDAAWLHIYRRSTMDMHDLEYGLLPRHMQNAIPLPQITNDWRLRLATENSISEERYRVNPDGVGEPIGAFCGRDVFAPGGALPAAHRLTRSRVVIETKTGEVVCEQGG